MRKLHGIVKYRTRKVETEKKLESTKLNLLRVNDIISEIEANIEPLKVQSEKARKFLHLRDELKDIEIGLFIHNIEDFKIKIKEIQENMDVFETQKIKEEEKNSNLSDEKEKLKEKLDELIEEIEKVQNIGFELSQKKEQINSEIGICNEKILNNTENTKLQNSEIEELEKHIQDLNDEKTQKIERRSDMLANKEKYESELADKEAELEKYSQTLSEKALEIEKQKKKLEENTDKRYEILNEKASAKANFENLKKHQSQLKNQIQDTISDLDGTRATKEDSSKGFYEIEKNRNKLSKVLEEIKTKREESVVELKNYDDKINTLSSEYRIKDSRCKFLIETEKEKEGYSKSVKILMTAIDKNNELAKGVHGTVADLISTHEDYQTAVEMTLMGSLQNIVTDTEQDAKRLIEYLKNNKIGRASFLPISAVKGQKLGRINTSGVDGYIGIASDLVENDSKYDGIVLNLLGRTVVTKDMDSAIMLAKKNNYSFKIVTLGGDIINPSGMMSGGATQTKTTSILGRKTEITKLQKELKSLEKEIKETENKKQEYSASIESILNSFDQKQQEFQEAEILYATEKQKIDNFDLEILKFENKLASLREALEKTAKEEKEIIQKQEQFDEKVNNIDKENEALNEVIEEYTNANRDNQKYIDDLNFNITNLKISVSSFDEGEASINEIMERIEQEIDANKHSIESKQKLITELAENNKNLENKIEKLNKQIIDFEKEAANSSTKVEELKNERVQKNEKLSKIELEINEQNEKIEDIRNQISKLELKKSKIDLEQNQIINKMWEEYELTPNNVGEIQKIENPQEVQKQVNSLRNQIRDIGSVDIDSIKRYQETKERYDFLSEQRLDLENAMAKLRKVIDEMTETMKVQFTEKFKIINKNFGEVFKELFGGGKAELILSDSTNVLESGIEIEVQPPGKKLQNMTLLSGGERAFTAIAILFAILKINPAPFCVLDEIEAALDDVNVFRFAEYLRKFAEETQFLVITHRKGTMEAADTVYGITMEEKGISKLLSMKLN